MQAAEDELELLGQNTWAKVHVRYTARVAERGRGSIMVSSYVTRMIFAATASWQRIIMMVQKLPGRFAGIDSRYSSAGYFRSILHFPRALNVREHLNELVWYCIDKLSMGTAMNHGGIIFIAHYYQFVSRSPI